MGGNRAAWRDRDWSRSAELHGAEVLDPAPHLELHQQFDAWASVPPRKRKPYGDPPSHRGPSVAGDSGPSKVLSSPADDAVVGNSRK